MSGTALVVGGGIAGLVAAHRLSAAGWDVTLAEATSVLGGAVSPRFLDVPSHGETGAPETQTLELDGGAESFAVRGAAVRALVEELGLGEKIVAPEPLGSWLHGPAGPVRAPRLGIVGIPGDLDAEDLAAALTPAGLERARQDAEAPMDRWAAALAAGCAVIVKPSEFTSASTLEFAALTKEAGIPDGIFNVVTGFGPEAGSALISHPGVAKITFTGSDTTGAKVYETAAKSLKRVSLELGGKSPNIVFEDADLTAAAAGAISGIFAATGQTCIAGSRLLVQSSIKEQFVARVLELAKSAKIGDPMQADTNVGPITTPAQYKKVLDYIDIAKAEGARCLLGGRPASGDGIKGGQFVEPTIFTDVDNSMRIAREEVFGPVLSIISFDTEADAVRIANDTIYGLAAGIWTKDLARAIRVPKQLRAGTVWVNTYRAISYMMPFGGMKFSGVGRESGIDAVREYQETKSVWISTATDVPANPFVMR